MPITRQLKALTLAFLITPALAPADTLMTKDGRIIDGPAMERGDDGVVIHFENGDITVPLDLVQEVFISTDTSEVPRSQRRKIEKQLAERRKQIEEAQAHSEWRNRYQEDTANFEWHYTIPKHIAEGLQVRFEAYYEYFKKLWRLKRNKREKPMLVNFYKDSKEYHRTSGAPGGALAYFKFVGRYDLNSCYDRLDPIETEMILYHELSHYVQKLIDEDFKMPHWPGEGVAEYYGGSLYDDEKRKLAIGLLQEGRLAEVKNDISLDKYLTVEEIVTKDAYTDYTWGWALVHFFKNDKKMGKAFDRYLLGLAREKGVKREQFAFGLVTVTGEESLRYLLECLDMEPEDLPDLDQRFHEYVVKELNFDSNTGKEKAAISAKRTGKRRRAERLFKEAEESEGGLSAMGCYQYAQLVRSSNKKKALALYRKAIELDPLVGTFYYELGRIVKGNDEDEGKRLMALGVELDPEVADWSLDFEFDGTDDE